MLHVSIQHHIARPDLPARLHHLLDEQVPVVPDPDPFALCNPWRGYKACLATTPDDCTHHLILQDDAMPCEGFLDAARTISALAPSEAVAFYVGGHASGEAAKIHVAASQCRTMARLIPCPWVPVVATMWPGAWAREMASFHLPAYDRDHVADDDVVGDWMRSAGHASYLATVPSLVQHDDEQISTLAGARTTNMRLAACFIGGYDAREIAWQVDC